METLLTTEIKRIGGIATIELQRAEYLLNLNNVISFKPYTITFPTNKEKKDMECTLVLLVGNYEILIDERFDALVDELHNKG